VEFSIYKQSISRDDFITNIKEKGLHRIGEPKHYESKIEIGGEEVIEGVTVDFFFKLEDDKVLEIEWASYWNRFFEVSADDQKTVETAFGIIIITFSDNVYSISMGRGYIFASKAAEMEFGFDIAEIIHDEESVEVKSARFFKKAKSRSLTQYNASSFVTNEIGESHELLVSKINLKDEYSNFLLYEYSEKMKFGSAVKIVVDNYQPKEILDIVLELNYLLNNEEKSGSLPRMQLIKANEDYAPLIADLNRNLIGDIKANNSNISLSYFVEEDGDVFVDPFADSEIELIYKKSYALDKFTVASIGERLTEIGCEEIDKVSIRTVNDSNKVQLMKVIDYRIRLNSKEYCLYKGRWATFNDSYIDYIEKEIARVNEYIIYDEEYNLTNSRLEEGRRIQQSDTEKYDQVQYDEYPYNIYLEHKYNYQLLDRKKLNNRFPTVEFADLYDKDEKELIHVKIGSTADFRYCIQQSLHSVEIFNSHSDVLHEYEITDIKKISILLVTGLQRIFNSDGSVNFSNSNSIYFKIELIEWFMKVITLGYTPEIKVAKKID